MGLYMQAAMQGLPVPGPPGWKEDFQAQFMCALQKPLVRPIVAEDHSVTVGGGEAALSCPSLDPPTRFGFIIDDEFEAQWRDMDQVATQGCINYKKRTNSIIDLLCFVAIGELVADGSLALDPRGVSASSIYVLGQATRPGTRGALMASSAMLAAPTRGLQGSSAGFSHVNILVGPVAQSLGVVSLVDVRPAVDTVPAADLMAELESTDEEALMLSLTSSCVVTPVHGA